LSTTTTTSRLETVLPFDAGLLKKGFFVSISFLSLRKGMRRRAPDEEGEAEFREFEDYALPKEIRNELNNLISRRQYIYERYSIPVESMKGHFIPNSNLPEVLDRAAELEKSLGALVEKIIARKGEINDGLAEFHAKYVRQGEPRVLPDDPGYIRREYGKFLIRVNSVNIATAELLNEVPELKNSIRSEMMEEVNKNARELEARIKKEMTTDLKKKVSSFVTRLAVLKKSAADGKKPHKNAVKAIEEDIKRLSALTSVDEDLSSLMKAVEGFANAVTEPEEQEAREERGREPEYVEAFAEFAGKLKTASPGRHSGPGARFDVDAELMAALKEAAK